jgi:hypothetical protein
MNPLEFLQTEEAFEKTARSQKYYLEGLAKKVEEGAALDALGKIWAAGAIRAFAETIPLKQKRKQGPVPKFCPASEAVLYASYRTAGMAHGQALAKISDRIGVSEVAINKAIKKHRATAFAMFEEQDPGNQ